MTIETRVASAADKAKLWDLYQSAMQSHIALIWGWDESWQIAEFEQGFASTASYVVEVDGSFAGYYQINMNGEHNYLRMLILAPRMRSAGAGARLLAEIHKRGLGAGRKLYFRVFKVNAAAQRFYEREGWEPESSDDAFHLMTHARNRLEGHAVNAAQNTDTDFVMRIEA
jgi:GNAT superfamily N-acetyltransferase